MGNVIMLPRVEETGVKPTVGAGVTVRIANRHMVFTIARVSDSGKTFWATEDKARVRSIPTYGWGKIFSPDPSSKEWRFQFCKAGWRLCHFPDSCVYLDYRHKLLY